MGSRPVQSSAPEMSLAALLIDSPFILIALNVTQRTADNCCRAYHRAEF